MTSRRGKRQAALAPETIVHRKKSRFPTRFPTRLAILCVAVLMISGSGGILIGDYLSRSEQLPRIEMVSTLVTPGGKKRTAEYEPSPFEYNNYPEDDTITAEGPVTTATPEAHVAALIAREVRTGLLAPNQPHFESTLPEPIPNQAVSEPPWRKYAALAPPLEGRPLIALIIDDVGLSRERVEELADLPGLLTMAFLPYASDLPEKADIVRRVGHEVMLHLPMEPMDETTDPGPDALLLELSPEELTRRVNKNLDSFDGYVGVNNHMGSRFTKNTEAMSLVMNILAERRLLFLDSKTTPESVGYQMAISRGMPSAKRDVFIDNVIEETAILRQLEKVERISSRRGLAIAIGHPHKATLSALQKWLPAVQARGFLLVPVSAVMSLKYNG